MSLYEEWKNMLENQTDETFEAFWKEYSDAEMAIYTDILNHKDEPLKGKLGELAEKYHCRSAIFEGFLDGVSGSLKNEEPDLESMTEDSDIDLDFDYEKLYYNMWAADAPHLYSLKAWDNVLSEEERKKISGDYKRSKIYHPKKKPGRNDPCPCGSGKKFKKCCMGKGIYD